jgi:ketosteroid isomerase-like protein
MNRILAALALAATSWTLPASARPPSPQAVVDGLVASDRAFSDLASRAGIGRAAAAMVDEDVLMPVPGGTFARGRADVLNALSAGGLGYSSRSRWSPVRAGISADGTHGFTWGYVETTGADGAVRLGKYLSYWVRRPGGWRVAAWRRVPRPDGDVSTEMLPPALPARLVAARPGSPAHRRAAAGLAAAESAFSDDAQRIGLGPAFARWGTEDAANMGRGPAFRIGAANIGADMPQSVPAELSWSSEGVLVAPSGDLGLSWGWIRPTGPVEAGRPAAFPFFTVWRRTAADGAWRYVAE